MVLSLPRFTVEPQVTAAAQNKPALAIGSRGEGVAILQQALIDLGQNMPHSTHNGRSMPDGIFGSETERAVKTFQTLFRLKADGVAGRLTFERLEKVLITDHERRDMICLAERFQFRPIG